MRNNQYLGTIELKLIDIYERFCDAEVVHHGFSQYTISSLGGEEWEANSTAELMENIVYTLNEWFSETFPIDLINGESLETVGDYLPLFLACPNNTTVLAVGNGGIAAPSTTTAFAHEDYNGTKFLTIFDYEQHKEAELKSELEELFPSAKEYEKPFTECFYTGGGIYCTIYQLSGKMSDYYYGFGSEEDDGTMTLYSHAKDKECNNDEFGFYGVVRYIDIETATEAERQIYYDMSECEKNYMKDCGDVSPRKF